MFSIKNILKKLMSSNKNDNFNDSYENDATFGENSGERIGGHVYRALGESGMVADEDGNIYDPSEIFGSDDDESSQREFTHNQPDEKTDPAYWDFYYDPRYCSGSREQYVGEMVSRHKKDE